MEKTAVAVTEPASVAVIVILPFCPFGALNDAVKPPVESVVMLLTTVADP
jgi:hypothetical protein